MNTAKLIESIEADKFQDSKIVVNDKGEIGVCLVLKYEGSNSGTTTGDIWFNIGSIEVYESYFKIDYDWARVQHFYNPEEEEGGDGSIEVDIDHFGALEEPIDREAMNEYYLSELWNYLAAYLEPDFDY